MASYATRQPPPRTGVTMQMVWSSRGGGTTAAVAATIAGLCWCYRFRIRDWVKRFVIQWPSSDKNDEENINGGALVSPPPSLPPHVEREMHKQERRRRLLPLLTMTKPMYDNILLQDPQGNALATISNKKAQWYIHKDLADWVVDETLAPIRRHNGGKQPPPPQQSILRLRFQPKHSSLIHSQQQEKGNLLLYNISTKANQCVVCGRGEHFNRHYVVPYCYRTLFPEAYKNHLSHDVVLTCFDCHIQAERYAQRRRTKLERGARKDPSTATPFLVDRHKQSIARQAGALLKYRDKLPLTKRQEYEHNIRQWHNLSSENDVLMEEILMKTSTMDSTTPNPNYIPGPVLVVQHFLDALETNDNGSDDNNNAALKAFVQGWRAYFVETSQPRFLPTGWDVYSPVHCD